MLAKLKQFLGLRTYAEKISMLPVHMEDDERKQIADLIAGFIDDSGGRYDWDWIMTGPKMSQEAECVSSLCASLDFIHPPKEEGRFTDDNGVAVLRQLVFLLRLPSAGANSRVFDFVDEIFKNVEQGAVTNS